MNQREYQRLLQFSDRWLQFGLLTEDEIGRLGREYEAGTDKAAEHYRYRVFRRYLTSHRPLTPLMSQALYELGREDPDSAMGEAMMRDIVRLSECPCEVLERAAASGKRHLIKAAGNRKLLAELSFGLTNDLFTRCLESGDGVIQRQLLTMPELTREQLERLVDGGTNRAVRNMAAESLKALGGV